MFKDGSYNFRDLATNELVGLVEVIDDYLGFAIFRKGLKTKVMGQQVFNSLIEYLKLNKVSFKGILEIWGKESDNTLVFNQEKFRMKKQHLKSNACRITCQQFASENFSKKMKLLFIL